MTAQSMLAETARAGDWLLATYALDLPADVDPWARVSRFAAGQTTGTWVEVPGLTAELAGTESLNGQPEPTERFLTLLHQQLHLGNGALDALTVPGPGE